MEALFELICYGLYYREIWLGLSGGLWYQLLVHSLGLVRYAERILYPLCVCVCVHEHVCVYVYVCICAWLSAFGNQVGEEIWECYYQYNHSLVSVRNWFQDHTRLVDPHNQNPWLFKSHIYKMVLVFAYNFPTSLCVL